jgi:hypothetical protein
MQNTPVIISAAARRNVVPGSTLHATDISGNANTATSRGLLLIVSSIRPGRRANITSATQ